MTSPYGGWMPHALIGASICINATNNTTIIANLPGIPCQDPMFWHIAGVLPIFAGGLMLSQTTVHAIKLWLNELKDWMAICRKRSL